MSYSTQATAARDSQLRDRIAACAATQDVHEPEFWAQSHQWVLVASPGWDAAYAYALNAANPAPGDDNAVISDAMILAAVQKLLTSEGTPA